MRQGRFLWRVHPLQALVEAWVLGLALLGVLYALKDVQPGVLSTGLFFMCAAAGTWAVLRARFFAGRFWRCVWGEIGMGVALAGGMVAFRLPTAASGQLAGLFAASIPAWGVTLVLLCTGAGYLGLRALAYVWTAWDRLRRRHMRWGLTHAHLMLVLLAAGAGSAAILALLPPARFSLLGEVESQGVVAALVARFLLTYFPYLSLLIIITLMALLVILPPAALFSYFAVRQTTRRVEALAAATAALRAGDYSARVRVTGEDELSQLQSDFNGMAETLQQTLHDLQSERDNVSALLRARRELVASVSHELRTPVTIARAGLDSLLDHWEEKPPCQARQELADVEAEVLRLQRLLDDLFTLSRAEVDALRLEIRPVDAGQLVQKMVAAMAPLAWGAGRVELLSDVAVGLPAVQADPERLKQVVANLLRNAIRYTAPGGMVAVSARVEGAEARFDVRDTGPGICPDDMPHIWDRFYRGAPGATAHDGGGLGLALVKELAEAMGGRVAAESAPGQGSCFSVWLPLYRGVSRAEEPGLP